MITAGAGERFAGGELLARVLTLAGVRAFARACKEFCFEGVVLSKLVSRATRICRLSTSCLAACLRSLSSVSRLQMVPLGRLVAAELDAERRKLGGGGLRGRGAEAALYSSS